MVENVHGRKCWETVAISLVSHFLPGIQCASGLLSAILNSRSLPMSDNVINVAVESGMVENLGAAIGISLICHFVLEKQCTSGILSAISNSGSRQTSDNIGNVALESDMVKNVWWPLEFR